ncbi:MAG: hypothetical protein KF729_06725 [Sandaracinaceae bacterium]|nr:hypothetical protein [Sandaracinaceae bacterium]
MAFRGDLEALTAKLRLSEAELDRVRARLAELEGDDPVAKAAALTALEARLAELEPIVQQAEQLRAENAALLAATQELEDQIAERDGQIAEREARIAELEPFVKTAEGLRAANAGLRERVKQLQLELGQAASLRAGGGSGAEPKLPNAALWVLIPVLLILGLLTLLARLG